MDTSGVTYNLMFLLLLLGASAFFSASETALFSINKIRLRTLVDNNIKNAKKVQNLLDKPDDLLSTILIMNNLVNITASSLATVTMYDLLGSAGVSVATGLITILVLVFGEITPKIIAIQKSEKIALSVINIIGLFVWILKPAVAAFSFLSTSISKLLKTSNDSVNGLTEEELKTMVGVGEENGVLDTSEMEMIYNVFDFGDLVAKDIMVQKINIVALDINSTLEDTMEVIKREKYSRIPVFEESMDNIVGILNIKDLLWSDIDENKFKLSNYIRKTNQTFEFKKVQELFKEMKKTKTHIFIVLDEYGATKGMITMEDMLEEIVGDIDDEYDTLDDQEIKQISENTYVVSGYTRMAEVIDKLNLPLKNLDEDFDSVGGYFIKSLNRFPNMKESILIDDIKFTIIDIDKKAIKKVKIDLE